MVKLQPTLNLKEVRPHSDQLQEPQTCLMTIIPFGKPKAYISQCKETKLVGVSTYSQISTVCMHL